MGLTKCRLCGSEVSANYTYYTNDLRDAFEAILKVRHHVASDAKINFETFREILAFLHKHETHGTEPEQSVALSELETCSAMSADDWLGLYETLSSEHAADFDDVPSR
jgi:hypothetical protein